MKYLSLFSGIGAFETALKRNGVDIELVGFSEIDKHAIKSYCAIHGVDESLNLGDISKIDLDNLDKDIELITHGSPCQDFSVAGHQRGGDKGSETRSSLMWCTVDIVEKVRPKYVVWENVKNLLSGAHIHNFNSYLEIMESMGYKNYFKVLNSLDYGIPQNRERVFTISILNGKEYEFPTATELKLKLKDMLEDEETIDEKYYLRRELVDRFIISTRDEKFPFGNVYKVVGTTVEDYGSKGTNSRGWVYDPDSNISTLDATTYKQPKQILVVGKADIKGHDCIKRIYSPDGVSPTLTNMQGGHRQPKIAVKSEQDVDVRVRKLTPKECWRLMGFSDEDFEKARAVGTSDTQLYKQAGNSIVVNVLEAVFKEMRW